MAAGRAPKSRTRIPGGRRTLVIGLVVLLALVGAGAFWVIRNRNSTPTLAATATTYTVEASTQQNTVSATGTLAPRLRKDLSFAVSGKINSVLVNVGDKVAKGATLASVDDATLQQALTVAQANLDAAQSSLDTLEDSSSATDAQLASGRAQVASSEAKVTSAQENLEAATLTSPIAGTVAAVNIEVGDQAGSSSGSGSSGASGGSGAAAGGTTTTTTSSSAAVTVVTPNSWVVNCSVSGSDIAQLKNGLQVQITPTSSTTKVFGLVSSVGVIGTTSSGTATFPVVVTVTGSPKGLLIGNTANVTIITKQLTDILTVPTLALSTANGKTVVQKMVDGAAVATEVTVGETFGTVTQITKGLASGDQIQYTARGFGGGGTMPSSGSSSTRGSGGGGFGGGGMGGAGMGAGGLTGVVR